MILGSIRRPVVGSAALGALLERWSPALAGEQPGQQPPQSNAHPAQNTSREALGPSSDSIHPYRPAGRDPFEMETAVKTAARGATTPRGVECPGMELARAE